MKISCYSNNCKFLQKVSKQIHQIGRVYENVIVFVSFVSILSLDGQFSVDMATVESDHNFLEPDSFRVLCQ